MNDDFFEEQPDDFPVTKNPLSVLKDLRVGFGRYRLIKKLGHGAFGNIFLGKTLKSGEEVAVKLVKMKALSKYRKRKGVKCLSYYMRQRY
jgi:serine/threonine protein kinase